MSKVCRGWNYTSNHSEDEDGRIIIIWKDTVSVRVLKQSSQSVSCEVKLPGSPLFVFFFLRIQRESRPEFFTNSAFQTWNFLREIEENYFKQRSRVNWSKAGDQNTVFFFRMVQTRMNFNFIRSFLLPSGVIISDPIQMSLHAVTHFQTTLGPSPAPPLGIISSAQWFQSFTEFTC
ncbi:BnaC05g18960D [Brassica napus]|uniref:BnaC05g18960D protein n=1 Tax=Brassica napus TaxID=3708 RepID=A0A078I9M3_BRANA|nr:BnaC05g18960D [Brassica napus]